MNDNLVLERRRPHTVINIFILLFILSFNKFGVNAISYRCENNQILIVQDFTTDKIRMHCQKLNLCGLDKLVNYI